MSSLFPSYLAGTKPALQGIVMRASSLLSRRESRVWGYPEVDMGGCFVSARAPDLTVAP